MARGTQALRCPAVGEPGQGAKKASRGFGRRGVARRAGGAPRRCAYLHGPAVRAFIHALIHSFQSQIGALETRIVELNARITELESNANKLTPRNSSVPPSTEHPHAKPKPKPRPGKKRKQGGQKGHKRTTRELIPSDQCQDVIERKPDACRKCGGELEIDGLNPTRHQVWELPPIKPVVIEYQLLRGHCLCCGITTQAELPEGVPTGQCGPRLAAFTGLLMGHFRQSKRRAASFLSDLLNIPCSASWTVKIQNLVSQAVSSPYEEVRGKLQSQPQLFVDESPTKEKNLEFSAIANASRFRHLSEITWA